MTCMHCWSAEGDMFNCVFVKFSDGSVVHYVTPSIYIFIENVQVYIKLGFNISCLWNLAGTTHSFVKKLHPKGIKVFRRPQQLIPQQQHLLLFAATHPLQHPLSHNLHPRRRSLYQSWGYPWMPCIYLGYQYIIVEEEELRDNTHRTIFLVDPAVLRMKARRWSMRFQYFSAPSHSW